MLQYNPTVTGSLQVSGDITGTVNGINITGLSQSVSTQLISVQVSTGSSDAKFETLSGVTSSVLTRLTNIETKSASVDISISNINSVTASNIARLSNLETKSSSVDISLSSINSYTSSNDTKFTTLGTYTGSLDTKNTILADVTSSLISKTGSYATTGSNQFYGTQVFSGSVYIANDLIVQGSSSIQYISASSVSIGTNIVQLNTANPSVRFAGLTIIDSGSVGGSGSFLYDSVQDEFIFVHRGNGTNVTSSHFVLGPETYDSLGNETYLTTNILSKGTGKEHLVDSCIFDNGTTTCIKNNLVGTGTACFTGNTIVSTSGNTTLTINGTSGVPALSFTNTGGTNNIYGGVGSVANITLAPGDVNAVKVFAAGCVSCFAGAITANGGLLIAGSPTGYPLGELQFNLTTNNSYSGISTLGTGTTTLYFDHRATSNTGNFVFRNGTAAANTLLTIAGSGAITATNTINVEQSNSAASTQMVITNTSNASTTTKTSQLLFKISDTAGTQKNSAYVQAIPDGVNVLSAHLAFGTRVSDNDSNEKMRITNGGNVGIGTCVPSQQLSFGMLTNSATRTYTTDNQGTLSFYNLTTGNLEAYLDIASVRTGNDSTLGGSNIRFLTQTVCSTISACERMRITSAGNVGIGTTSPGTLLQVSPGASYANNPTIQVIQSYADGYDAILSLANCHTGGRNWSIRSTNNSQGNFGGCKLVFQDTTAGSSTSVMTLVAGGNVGINQSFPCTQLQVRKNYWQFWTEKSHGSNVALFSVGIPVFGAAIVQIAGSKFSPGADNYIGFSTVYIRTNNVGAIAVFSCDSGTYQPSYYVNGNTVNFCSLYAGITTNYTGVSVSVQASGHNNGSEAAVTVSLL